MTKPRKLALGIGVAGIACLGAALEAQGPARWLGVWTAAACGVVAFAYLANRPAWLGKRDGRMSWHRTLPVLPYLVAFRVAMALRRALQRGPDWHEVAPGLYVGARVPSDALPAGLELVLDLTSEWPAPRGVRRLPGYRSLPVLDGSTPPDAQRFLALLEEAIDAPGGVYVHCEEGKGRAPTAAAALLLARGVAADVDSALELVRKGRPAARPTRSDRRFLEALAPRLRPPPSGLRAPA